ncbi:CHAT domain-containing protein [Flavobacterium sp.]|uniref:CHAT domain-containing protein n=1 Tax=Flavobacterium sp. TaxID=239 RepID=UPI003F697E21
MNRKKQINEISNLLSNGFSVIYRYINNSYEFLEAEKNNSVNYFFDSQTYLDDNLRQKLKLFFFIQNEISEKYIERHRLVLSSGITDLEDYSFYVNKGIASVKEFLDTKLKEDEIPNRFKILYLVDKHIQLIENNFDDLTFFLEEESISNEDLLEAYNDGNSVALSYEILKRINPREKTFLDIEHGFSEELLKFMSKELVFELINEYGKEEAKRIFGNLEERLDYLTSDNNDRESLAHLALMINQILHYSDEYEMAFPLIYKLASLYKDSYLIEGDIDVLIKLYEYIANQATDVNLSLINPNTNKNHLNLLNRVIRNNLGELYISAWEKDKAIEIYKESAKYWDNEVKNIEIVISNIEDVYNKIGSKIELIDFQINILNSPSAFLHINENISLSEELKYLLSSNLSVAIGEYEFSPNEYNKIIEKLKRVQTPILDFFNSIIENDVMNSDNLENFLEIHSNNLKFFSDKYELDDDVNLNVGLQLNDLRIIDPDIHTLEQVLIGIEKKYEELNEENIYLFRLFQAKLKFSLNDISSIKEYFSLLENEYFNQKITSVEEQNYWYREYLRAINLNIYNDTSLNQEILKYVKKKLDNAVIEYYENNGTKSALFFIQEQVEECVRCVLESIDKSSDPDFLYHVLYSILYFKNNIILWKFQKQNIINNKQFIQLNNELRTYLANLYFFKDNNSKQKIEDTIFEIRKLSIPELRETSSFNLISLPVFDTIAYHIFTKRDNEHLILKLNYNVNSSQKFSWEIKDFKGISDVLEEAKNELRWEFDNVTLLSSIKVYNENLYNLLISDDEVSQKINNLFFGLGAIKIEHQQLLLDGSLYNIPFEMLQVDDSKPLGVSSKLTIILNKERDDIFVDNKTKFLILSEINELPNFSGLEETILERHTIEKLCKERELNFTSLFEQNATFENFKKYLSLNQPNIIHISVHGKFMDELPYETTCLILEPSNNDKTTSLLTYNDILSLDLSNVDLVVLSGCNTASGNILKGTPMLGLAYAFLAAGSRAVLASKLEVDVNNTANILNIFYKNLLSDQKSVQEAFRSTLNDFHKNESFRRDISSWSLYT